MAVPTDAYFSNSVQGIPQVAGDVDIYRMDSTPRHALGFRLTFQDGREFVYSHFGADTNRGVLVSTDVSESSQADDDNNIVAPASANDTTDGTIGSRFVEITAAGVTVDQFAGGYFVTTDDTGEGFTYRIKGNTATDTPASGNYRLELHDPLVVAVDATTDYAIQGFPFANLEIATVGTDNVVAGVTVNTMDVSEADYGWVQVKGICGILQDGTIAIGDPISLSDGVNGAVQVLGGGASVVGDLAAEEILGTCLIAGDNTGHGVFKINTNL